MADEYYQKAGEYPYLPDIPVLLSDVLPPVPYSFYEQADGEYPVIADMPDIVKAVSPVPYSFYFQKKDEYPSLDVPNVVLSGAFYKAHKLSSVVIPSTVRSIGKYSFTYTALTSVVLPDNCTYYVTSFPEGCTVTGGVLIA